MDRQKILITGASSYVGAKIYQDLKQSHQVVGTYFSHKLFDDLHQLDLTDSKAVSEFIKEINPDVIVHVAAHANERQIEEHGADLNIEAVEYLTQAAKEIGSKVIFISSFAAYTDSGVYGESKRSGEESISSLDNYVILRPSLVMGLSPNTVNDRQFNRLLKNIIDKTEAKYDTSWEFEMTYLKHLSEMVDFVIAHPEINRVILPVVASGVTNRYQIAKDILANFNISVESEDKNAAMPIPELDLSDYENWHLPSYTYQDAIDSIVLEIKEYIRNK